VASEGHLDPYLGVALGMAAYPAKAYSYLWVEAGPVCPASLYLCVGSLRHHRPVEDHIPDCP
jgi:hypothetical protein